MSKLYQKDIISLVPDNSRVLDLGCAKGDLLYNLKKFKHIHAVGVDISTENVCQSISKGISTIQGNIDEGLSFYDDKSFDVVILSQTLQVVRNPLKLLQELLRIGKMAIIIVPNFGHWRLRSQIFFKGRMPKNKTLQYEWYNTPNIHLASIKDFEDLFAKNDINILEKKLYLSNGSPLKWHWAGNLLSEIALFVIKK
ncbi:methionine biosynthesis protein MetW [PVC group bacterium (ex Bugula neritina AB1)]|nr:methionine biosynthesis protein MetW [PVC group bacterium (ex Bugula neritina AB1)]